MEKIAEIKNLNFKYSQQDSWLFHDFNLAINRYEWLAIIGHNGSGKSTLARLIDGLLVPQAGEIWIDQQKMSSENVWQLRKKLAWFSKIQRINLLVPMWLMMWHLV